ncbi:MAG: nucleotidyltransferase domain-containing protein [Deltaproteobacteria bacterium]|nr:nucleotidyltransferase domain-containing protein [Deltaproteobacteria bacterium]MBI4794383.1 nucleotidyltransferase domain-containing protein [Deltaproteobacteria bacterium]
MLTESDRLLIEELKHHLQEVAGDRLQAVLVYGSRAWGEPGPDSDLDIAVLIQGLTSELEEALHEAAYQVMWEHDFTPIISLKVFDALNFAAFHEQGFSFYRKVAREGIPL